MSWFNIGEEAKGIGEGTQKVTQGIRHLLTGETPPEVIIKLDEIDKQFNDNFTKRVISDNNTIARYVRPMSLLITLTIFFLFAYTNNTHTDTVESLLEIMIAFYFSSRGLEKISGLVK